MVFRLCDMIQVLFVCSKNQWRSPTAEKIFARHAHLQTRSAGTAASARHQINVADVQWADVIMCMEDKHARRLRAEFPSHLKYKKLHVLGIPDNYRYMDPALIDELEELVPMFLDTSS